MSKKISELTETIEPQDNDVLAIVNENETKKVKLTSIIAKIKTAFNSVYASITHTHAKSEITDFPTKVSEFENDSGFLNAETDPSVPSHVKNITQDNINAWNSKADTSQIPNKTSQLSNDSDFTTKTYVDGIVGNVEAVLETITTGAGV